MQEGEGTGEGLESGQQREHVLQEQGICSAFHTRVTGDSLLKEAACSHQTGGNGEKPMSPSSGMVRCVSGQPCQLPEITSNKALPQPLVKHLLCAGLWAHALWRLLPLTPTATSISPRNHWAQSQGVTHSGPAVADATAQVRPGCV